MGHLLRKLAYYYREGGVGASLSKTFEYGRRVVWSDSLWVVYWRASTKQAPPNAPQLLVHRELGLEELAAIGYSKAREFPQDIRRRFERGNVCHGFHVGDQVATIGWSSPGYLELDRDVVLPYEGSVGLFDFVTLEEFRSRGCYTSALIQLSVEMRRRGFAGTYIAVDPGNAPSIRGIERAGFRRSTTVRRRWRIGVRRLICR